MRLERMADQMIPAPLIAKKLHRTEAAVRAEARKQRVMLAPPARQLPLTSKQPYGGIQVATAPAPVASSGRRSPAAPRARRPEQHETLF